MNTPIAPQLQASQRILSELNKLGIKNATDLLFYLPYRYENFSNLKRIIDLRAGEKVSIAGTIKEIKAMPGFRGRISRCEAVISDQSGSIKAVWFNQPYLSKTLNKGEQIFLSGLAREYKGLQLQNPIYEKISEDNAEQHIHTARILPIYKLPTAVPQRTFRTLVYKYIANTEDLPDELPGEIKAKEGLPDLGAALNALHFPASEQQLAHAQERAAFEQTLPIILAVEKHKLQIRGQSAYSIPFKKTLAADFIAQLPFELTAGQKRAAWDILQDIGRPYPMNRLLEGDVGSGKTLVALIAALETLQAGYQAALLCPTEILAIQHYNSALKYFENFPRFSLVLLTAKNKRINGAAADQKRILEELAHGGSHLVISTQAALQKKVAFKKLALVIIDEQHRFGVRQRAKLLGGGKSAKRPHLLSMTATPIPRTLKLSLFGDLQISELKTKPQGRKPVITKFVPEQQRTKAYAFVQNQLANGRQAFVVVPLIEASENLQVKAAESELANIKKIFPKAKAGLLHGKQKSEQKEKIMAEFLAHELDILVSTSVIEVGVDVPNASVIIIEGAERFGLAQLHQLRGRVGRSEHQSYCLLFKSGGETDAQSQSDDRLLQFCKTYDGFALAELDLQNRGYGDIFGQRQSGRSSKFNPFASTAVNNAVLEKVRFWAKKILEENPGLEKYPLLNKKVNQQIIHLE